MDIAALRAEISEHRRQLEALEEKLAAMSSAATRKSKSKQGKGFYTSYYVISGLVLGAIAAWVTLVFNVIGGMIAFGDPFRLLKVYATFFAGSAALDGQQVGVAVLLALILHSATGSVVGAPLHVAYSRFIVQLSLQSRLMWGVVLGLVMWLVNFYGILSWLQPMVSNSSYIIDQIPFWVAALTHIAFTLTMLVLQPYWAFDPKRMQGGGQYPNSIAADA